MKKLLAAGEEPVNCYFADNDLIAAGALRAFKEFRFKEFRYRVLEDIAIIGFDDLPLCEYILPSLSKIEVPKYFMGENSAMRMIQIIEKKKHASNKNRSVHENNYKEEHLEVIVIICSST